MSAFVVPALLLATLAALFLAIPLLRRRADALPAPIAAAVAVLLVITASAILYRLIGNRDWSRLDSTNDGNATIAALARHLEAQPRGSVGMAAARGGLRGRERVRAGAARLRARQSPQPGR